MSKQDAMKFLDKMEKDATFREQLKNAKDAKERKKILSTSHLEFTKNECEEALKEKYKKPLSEDQLKKVVAAGGKGAPQSFEQYKSFIKTLAAQSE